MAQAVNQAREERELTKAALEARLDQFEGRVRAELDWKARLLRDGPRYAVMGAIALGVVAGGLVLRKVLSGSRDRPDELVAAPTSSLDDVARQLGELRKEVAKARKSAGAPMVQKLVVKAATAAGSAAGTLVAKQAMQRFTPATADTEGSPLNPR